MSNFKVIPVNFPETSYFRQEFAKSQICIHHTVSGGDAMGDINWWIQRADKISTSVVIDRTGDCYQCYPTKYWGYHLGVRPEDITAAKLSVPYHRLDYSCIGIEIDSWGGLIKDKDEQWYPMLWDATKKKALPNKKCAPIENVIEYKDGFRGFYGFEEYTNAQINTVKELLEYWCKTVWNIPTIYNEDMWNISAKALSGTPGIWTHDSFRLDKSDAHPQESLISMLKSL